MADGEVGIASLDGGRGGKRQQRLKWGRGKDGRKLGCPFTRVAVDMLGAMDSEERPWRQYGDRDGAAWKRFAERLTKDEIFQGYHPDPGPMRAHLMELMDRAGELEKQAPGGEKEKKKGAGSRGGAGRSHRAELNAMQKMLGELYKDRESARLERESAKREREGKGKGKRPFEEGEGGGQDGVLPMVEWVAVSGDAAAAAAAAATPTKKARVGEWARGVAQMIGAERREEAFLLQVQLWEERSEKAIDECKALAARVGALEDEVKRLQDTIRANGNPSAGTSKVSSKVDAVAESGRRKRK